MNRRKLLTTPGAAPSLGLCAGIGARAPGCAPAQAAEPISADLASAIERHRAATATWQAMLPAHRDAETALGYHDPAFRRMDDALNDACHHGLTIMDEIVALPVHTLADVQVKVGYLSEIHPGTSDHNDTVAALLASMSREGEGDRLKIEPGEPDEMAHIATAYIAANEALNAARFDDDDKVDAFCTVHIDPLRDRLLENAPVPTTMAGALAAARLAERSFLKKDDDLVEPLIVALRQFLEGRA